MARKRQAPLPGCEDLFIPELDAAAADYQDIKMKRVQATDKETEAKKLLLERMISHGKEHYKSVDDIIVMLTEKRNVKTSTAKDEQSDISREK